MRAQKALEAEGGTFENGVYTRMLPDGRKITKDGHAACFEYLTGEKIEFPKPRFSTPIVMQAAAAQWSLPIASCAGVEHKYLGHIRRAALGRALHAHQRRAQRFRPTSKRMRRSAI